VGRRVTHSGSAWTKRCAGHGSNGPEAVLRSSLNPRLVAVEQRARHGSAQLLTSWRNFRTAALKPAASS
jgi:hypothetical protein